MRWQGGEQSENLEDRRRLGPKTLAFGGVGALLLAVVGYFLGVNPQKLNQLIGNAQVAENRQNDYLAGVWAHHGQKKFNFIEAGDIESAIKSANAIGDDRLQKRATGFTSPENYTHGTSSQRVKWFRQGLQTGDLSMLKSLFEIPYGEL